MIPSQTSFYDRFTIISGWTDERPEDIAFFDISRDNEWYYFANAEFLEDHARTNPTEDFSSIWKLYFDDNASALDRQRLVSKVNILDQLFSQLLVPLT